MCKYDWNNDWWRENFSIVFPHQQLSHLHSTHYKDFGTGNVEICHANEEEDDNYRINLDGGCTERYMTSTIVSDSDRQLACERTSEKGVLWAIQTTLIFAPLHSFIFRLLVQGFLCVALIHLFNLLCQLYWSDI